MCRFVMCPLISRANTGMLNTRLTQNRRLMSMSSGLRRGVAATSSGSRAIPQMGHAPVRSPQRPCCVDAGETDAQRGQHARPSQRQGMVCWTCLLPPAYPAARPRAVFALALLVRSKIDHGRDAGMGGALVHLHVLLGNMNIVKIAERLLQHGARIEVFDLFGPSGSIFQLFWPIALNDQKPARLERVLHVGPFYRALCGRAELGEDFDRHIEGGFRISPGVSVRLLECHSHAALARERLGFALRCGREIDGHDIKTLLG